MIKKFVIAERVEERFSWSDCGYVPTVIESKAFDTLEEAKKEMPDATRYIEFGAPVY